jgi:hypothetical protein
MVDWGTVPGWIGAIAGCASATLAGAALFYSYRAANQFLHRERRRLARSVLAYVENGQVIVSNFGDQVITQVRAYFEIDQRQHDCSLKSNFVTPGGAVIGVIPTIAAGYGRDALICEFQDSRGFTWRNCWDVVELLDSD